jgi:hypothetical protein
MMLIVIGLKKTNWSWKNIIAPNLRFKYIVYLKNVMIVLPFHSKTLSLSSNGISVFFIKLIYRH